MDLQMDAHVNPEPKGWNMNRVETRREPGAGNVPPAVALLDIPRFTASLAMPPTSARQTVASALVGGR
jgi:hypothetical protein